jgi:agmatine/peptidylarginine deiminase
VAALAPAARVDYVYDHSSGWLPAYRNPLLPSLKADANSDIRAAHPERYALTDPPANIADIRPMVEWEPMKAIMLQWPADYLSFAKDASETMALIAKHSVLVAEVWVVTGVGQAGAIKNHLLAAGISQGEIDTKVKVVEAALDSIWLIDSGPLPIIDTVADTFAFADFRYYPDRPYDDGVPTLLGRALPEIGAAGPVPTYRMPLNVEGGTFQATSDGVCFTGNRQLYYMSCDQGGCDNAINSMPLDEVQTHPLTLQVEQIWKDYVGCQDVIILHSITDDGTGHIDMFMKVVDDNTVLMGDYRAPFQAGTPQQANAARMDANAAFLEAYVKADGTSFTVPRLVMPGHRTSSDGMVPFTYLNSTFVNGLNLWPTTVFPEWEASRLVAEAEWQAAMPDYSHIGIDSAELSFWSGAIHCITRTIPDKAPGLWVADGTCTDGTCGGVAGGYAGECQPVGLTEDICWGPAWQCECNDCTQACPEPGSGTGECPVGLGYTGCCDGDANTYCDAGKFTVVPCNSGCGWSAGAQFYDCAGGQSGAVAGTEDPTGQDPRDCKAVYCEGDCTGKVCGDDGCGGSCGDCTGGLACTPDGQCAEPCADACAAGDAGCDGSVAWLCQMGAGGCLEKLASDCATTGQICKQGACFDAPIGVDDAGGSDVSGGSDAAGGADAGGGSDVAVVAPPKKGSSGCAAGGGAGQERPLGPLAPGLLALLALVALVTWRRRA